MPTSPPTGAFPAPKAVPVPSAASPCADPGARRPATSRSRSLGLWAGLLAAALLWLTPPSAHANAPAEPTAAALVAQGESEPQASTWRQWEARADGTMQRVNAGIETVFFYPVPLPLPRQPQAETMGDLAGEDWPEGVEARVATWDVEVGDRVKENDPIGTLQIGIDRIVLKAHTGGRIDSLPHAVDQTADRDGSVVILSRPTMPMAVLWLVFGAVFLTLRMGFVNLRGFGHALAVVRGRFTNPRAQGTGEVSHFQALTAALSATVGLGNIAGVAIAISVGGPGATFWMIVAGLLGMSSKFAECTLGQRYRQVRPDGSVMGGAMFYLSNGLKEIGLGALGKVLAVFFVVLCIGGSLGGGNSFQVRQSLDAVSQSVPFLQEHGWIYGALMTFLVGIVIIGGIKRIAQVAEKVVPSMCLLYIGACLFILFANFGQIGWAFGTILAGAFTPEAGLGGLIGVLIQGFQRAAFSNEAGIGSAAIAHAAAKTDYPVREGFVALLEPFIDTVVICTMTALVIIITQAYADPQYAALRADRQGALLTSQAMGSVISWFPYLLSVAVALFAFSTMISWSYYGERCWCWLVGDGYSLIYKVIFLIFTFLGSVITAKSILDFSDLMILGMALPNLLGVLLLSGLVRSELDAYWKRLQQGEFETYK